MNLKNLFNMIKFISYRIIIGLLIILGSASFIMGTTTLKVVYCSPMQNSVYNSPNAKVIFRLNEIIENGDFDSFKVIISKVDGTIIPGNFLLADDQRTIVFSPIDRFGNGNEIIAMLLYNRSIQNIHSVVLKKIRFKISANTKPDSFEEVEFPNVVSNNIGNKELANRYRELNGLPSDFPAIIIVNKNKPSGGYYFLSSRVLGGASNGTNYMFCADTNGTVIFYKALENRGADFRRQPNGYLTHYPEDIGHFIQYDSSYNEMKHYSASDGFITDSHELLLEDNGNYWLFTRQLHVIDMSVIVPGGNPYATVSEGVIQHLDRFGNLLGQWNSLDHIPITDTDPHFVNLTSSYIDYIHMNALDFDEDGNILLSSRHLNEITKINVETGNIIWRLGGSQNQFAFADDDLRFYGQHSIRNHGSGIYTLFDNGNFRHPIHSRGVEYTVDENEMTVTLNNEFITNDGASYSNAMGHMQRTSDNGTLIGWAANTQGYILTDYNYDGAKTLDMMNLDTMLISYRAYKYNWETNAFFFISDTVIFEGNISLGDSIIATSTIYNNSNIDIQLSGFHTTTNTISITNNFPVNLTANSSYELDLVYKPVFENHFTDVLTIYSNSNGDSMRIAAQTRLIGGIVTSNESYDDISIVNISPNPMINGCRIEVSNNSVIDEIRIIDLCGRTQFINSTVNSKSFYINRNSLKSGITIIGVKTNNGYLYSKLIVN